MSVTSNQTQTINVKIINLDLIHNRKSGRAETQSPGFMSNFMPGSLKGNNFPGLTFLF